jgi:hypothetical protein
VWAFPVVIREGKLSTQLIDDAVVLELGQRFLQRPILLTKSIVLDIEAGDLGDERIGARRGGHGILDSDPWGRTYVDDVIRAGKTIAVWTGIMHVCSWSILVCRRIVYKEIDDILDSPDPLG